MEVTLEEATSYANWLSATTGKIYRLISETEWERIMRGSAVTPSSNVATNTDLVITNDLLLAPFSGSAERTHPDADGQLWSADMLRIPTNRNRAPLMQINCRQPIRRETLSSMIASSH